MQVHKKKKKKIFCALMKINLIIVNDNIPLLWSCVSGCFRFRFLSVPDGVLVFSGVWNQKMRRCNLMGDCNMIAHARKCPQKNIKMVLTWSCCGDASICSSLWCDPALAFELSWLWPTDDKLLNDIMFALLTTLLFPVLALLVASSGTITWMWHTGV